MICLIIPNYVGYFVALNDDSFWIQGEEIVADNIIEDNEVVKDLGIYLSNDGTFPYHINQVIKKVKQ